MLSWSLGATTWRVLKLRVRETAGGYKFGKYTVSESRKEWWSSSVVHKRLASDRPEN